MRRVNIEDYEIYSQLDKKRKEDDERDKIHTIHTMLDLPILGGERGFRDEVSHLLRWQAVAMHLSRP